ncbi:MAG: helix-turn-helix domain-containing protein [Methanogenium sp.]|jgi:DNA-binding transcriptional regulator LsrR (DeoR family)
MRGKKESNSDVARELGISRQAVSHLLRRAMKKVYKKTKRLYPEYSPFEVALFLMKIFDITDTDDVVKYFKLFDPEIRREIKIDVIMSRRGIIDEAAFDAL